MLKNIWFFPLQGLLVYQKVNHIIDWPWQMVLLPTVVCLLILGFALCVSAFSK